MSDTIIVAAISLAGSLVGTFAGTFSGIKQISYRIEQLEKKVDIQSKTASRIPVIEEKISNINFIILRK